MASIVISNLDEDARTHLRMRVAGNGRSMEEEARLILREAVDREKGACNLARTIRIRVAPLGDVDLELPTRGPMRNPPFVEWFS